MLTRAEKVIWPFFAFTCFQLVFLQPSIILVRGERANLFSGLLCLLTLTVTIIFAGRGSVKFKSPEFLASAALTVLGVASAFNTLVPLPSFFRVAILLASGLGGFWCARFLLHSPENQRRFQWLCLCLLGGLLLVCLTGYAFRGEIHYFFDKDVSHRLVPYSNHPLIDVIALLSFAPLSLLGRQSRSLRLLGAGLVVLSYLIICLSQRLSMVFIPLGLGALVMLFGVVRWKQAVAALLVVGVIIGLSFHQILWFKLDKKYPSYRIENIFFSLSVARQHPFLGVGLRTPREPFLKDYQFKYPYTDKEQFAKDLKEIVTADSLVPTFISSLGLPFTLIYFLAVLALLAQLIRLAFRPPPGLVFPPLALLFPLGLALAHWQLYDGLLFAQGSWFFHILLGLIPVGAAVPVVQEGAADGPEPTGE